MKTAYLLLALLSFVFFSACSEKALSETQQQANKERAMKNIAGVKPNSSSDAANENTSNDPQQKIEKLFARSCASCHISGVAGAPRLGDTQVWQQKIDIKGMEHLIASVRNGLRAMPPMGSCGDCSDEDFAALIEYMASAK